ncbi:MAG: bifunctional phosphoglucose/phosphomannose isomerase [Dictyoglomaceae bacterium]|nr:bifunctional phosphoglucose/phosphomannose isomerase [Dictyoglomaceae bacterium]HPU43538.1 bifunctional phosphoglucose/phosphomannose isomerase [Dictyoglomaceae bacterium]
MVEKLDQIAELNKLDPKGMHAAVYHLPEQIEKAAEAAYNAPIKNISNKIDKVLALGMGGSAIAGDILQSILFKEAKFPVYVNRDYDLPNWVDNKTLVFAISYSGNTVETLNSAKLSYGRGASVVAVTSGGNLKEYAKDKNLTLVEIPSGMAPRAAIGYVTIPLFVILERLGLIHPQKEVINETIEYLKKSRENFKIEVPTEGNIAKKVAKMMFKHIPVVYAVEEKWKVAAYRWKCQINENAKYPGFYHFFPELNHNEIMSWEAADDVIKPLVLIFLYTSLEGEMKVRVDFMQEKISARGVPIFLWQAEGKSPLTQYFSLTYLGDFATVYLAYLADKDPSSIGYINELKLRIGQSLS